MEQITSKDMLPKKLQQFGMFDNEAISKLKIALKDQSQEVKDMLMQSDFLVYRCSNVTDLAVNAMLDECEKQVIIDFDTARYYFCALTIDPARKKMVVVETEMGKEIAIDSGQRPARVLYFTEISHGDYKRWRRADTEQRRNWLMDKLRREEAALREQR